MSRHPVAAWLALLTIVVSIVPTEAGASGPARARRVMLLETPAALERALRTALVPWGMRVARAGTRAKPARPRSAKQAQRLAQQLRADALIWLAPSARRHELWLYDRASDSMTARPVPAPPFDETRAAALALSVKTDLLEGTQADAAAAKSSEVAATSTADQPSVVVAADADAMPSVLDQSLLATGEPGLGPSEPAEVDRSGGSAAPVGSVPPSLRLLLHAAARIGTSSLAGAEGRYALEARWAPWSSATDSATLWLAGRIDLGLPEPLDTPLFDGEYSELGGGVGVGANMRLSRWFELGLQLGASAHSASVSGTIRSDGASAEQARIGVGLHVRPEMELSLGRLGVLLQPALGVRPKRERYTVDTEQLMETQTVCWQLGAALRVDLL